MKNMFKISGTVRNYGWGGQSFIPELLGFSNDQAKPCAEYWLGAHESAPSTILDDENSGKPITELISLNPEGVLGAKLSGKCHALPFLFKVLDVKDMLSIQVHPSKESAEVGFEAEDAAGIPVDAPDRNYRDRNHKPELMVALSDFWLLHGFKSAEDIRTVLLQRKCYQPMIQILDESGVKGLFEWALSEVSVTESVSRSLLEVLEKEAECAKSSPEYWIWKWTRNPEATHRGLLVILMMNVVNIPKGEAIFQSAGIIHAYLEGQNIEIMANSDNVLRGGLTEKHMDVEELIKHTRFETINPAESMIPATAVNEFEKWYDAPVEDFLLSEINLSGESITACKSDGFEIFFVFDGSVTVTSDQDPALIVSKGEAFAVTYGSEIQLSSRGCNSRIFRAKTNV